MLWPEANAKRFPSPHRHEAPNLRQDILDELADHLALAAEEEMEMKRRPVAEAWARALARFGNPDAIARRLWWDAMREKVMRDWIQTGLAAVSAIVVAFVAVLLVQNMRQMQGMQTTQAELLKAVKGMAEPEPIGLPLDVEVRRGSEDGPLAPGVRVTLSGNITGGDSTAEASLETDSEGQVHFFPVPQGKYTLQFWDPISAMDLRVSHSLFAGVGATLRVVAPSHTAVPTRVEVEASLPFRDERVLVYAEFRTGDTVGGFKWYREGAFLVGHAGVYARPGFTTPRMQSSSRWRTSYVGEFDAPLANMSLPPLPLEIHEIKPVFFVAEDDGHTRNFTAVSIIDNTATTMTAMLGADGLDAITLRLTEKQILETERIMKNYSIASRWTHRTLGLQNRDSYKMTNGRYVVDALPLDDVAAVRQSSREGTQAVYEIREPEVENEAVTASGQTTAFRVEKVGELAKRYPENALFMLSCHATAAECRVVPWYGRGPWAVEPGATIDVALGEPLAWRQQDNPDKRGPLVDVTAYLRPKAGVTPAAGFIVQQGSVLLDTERSADQWRRPHLLVLSDTPPADL